MNDDLTRDELAAAYLDGALGATDRARVEADPALGDRVERFRLAAAAVAAPVEPPPPSVIDAAVRRALAEPRSRVGVPAGTADVGPGPGRRHRREARRAWPGPLRWAIPAVAAAAIVAAVVGIVQRTDRDATVALDATTSTAAPAQAYESGGADASSGPALALPDLGPIETRAALRTALEPLLASARDDTAAVGPAEPRPPGPCVAEAAALAPGATLSELAHLAWQGSPATALLATGPDGEQVLVLALDACVPLTRLAP
ncbi:MAG: hypothetical protein IPM45_10250 [Acidimicrobiales bacterium]|nr:hypothetical protein [Acidimicrobiales bacterium]